MVFRGQGILLDVEGTTSSISFVYDVLFVFARTHLAEFLLAHCDDQRVAKLAAQLAAEASLPDSSLKDPSARAGIVAAALDLMKRDINSTPLKALQGMIWRSGFESGELVADVFSDVPVALHAWADSGLDVRIYSSGSIEAQQLFFSHTCFGDLTPFLRGHYDTTTGHKREAKSYATIAAQMSLEPSEILFVSDIGGELDAACAAGMMTCLIERPGNPPQECLMGHATVQSFAEIIT